MAYKLEEIERLLRPVFEQNSVIKAIVFGSHARQTATKKSDLDLLLIMHTEKRFFDRYEAFNPICDLLKNTAVDMLIYTPEELKSISHRAFIRKILKEGITIYEQ